MDVNDFDRQARREHVRIVAEATEVIRTVGLSLYSDMQTDAKTVAGYGSPVASGRFAGSLRLGVNQIDRSVEPPDPNYRYPPGNGPRPLPPRTIRNQPISRIAALLRTFRLGDTIYISNSVPYARRIETGGHSWQTPDGAFGPTVRRLVARFRNARVRLSI